jgi:hypothetical protein
MKKKEYQSVEQDVILFYYTYNGPLVRLGVLQKLQLKLNSLSLHSIL